MSSKTTMKQSVLNFLAFHKDGITSKQAADLLRIDTLPTVINQLQADGHEILFTWVDVPGKAKDHRKYFLKIPPKPEAPKMMTHTQWWMHGCRVGESEPHRFFTDCPSDQWISKTTWDAAQAAMKMNDVQCVACGHPGKVELQLVCERCGDRRPIE